MTPFADFCYVFGTPFARYANVFGTPFASHVRIIPNQEGGFLIEGLTGARNFGKFDEADDFARNELARMVRELARAAGTSSRVVEFKTKDKIATSADGTQIFMGRTIHAKLTGQPDIVIKDNQYRMAAAAN